jgi:hypothetical protein
VHRNVTGGLLFAITIVGAWLAACSSSSNQGACPSSATAAQSASCDVAGLACCYGSVTCSCEGSAFACTNNMGCPAQPPDDYQPCTTLSSCSYPSAFCTCDAVTWQCNTEPGNAPRSCVAAVPEASIDSATPVPCGQADPNHPVPFMCNSSGGLASCCSGGDIYSYLASACVGTWCPAGTTCQTACQSFACGDGGESDSGCTEDAAETEEAGANEDAPSAPTDSATADRAETEAPPSDAAIPDSAADAGSRDASAGSPDASAGSSDGSTDASVGAEAATTASDSSADAPNVDGAAEDADGGDGSLSHS